MKTKLIGIAAMDPNRVIGNGLKIPWHYSEDFKFFKKTTLGYPIVMGRSTFESLGSKPLPKRNNIVISSQLSSIRTDISVLPNIEGFFNFIEYFENFKNPLEYIDPNVSEEKTHAIFVIGGAQLYKALMPHLSAMYVTHIKKEYEGDVFMPDFESHLTGKKWLIQENDDFKIAYYERPEK